MKTGRIDHRHVCGKRFYVMDGVVSDATKHHSHTCPTCGATVWSRHASGRIQSKHKTPAGTSCACKEWTSKAKGEGNQQKTTYICPFCDGNVKSKVQTGQVNHRSVCGNQFYVKEGAVSNATRKHPHKCPQCTAVVWSQRKSGRIQSNHNTPGGAECPCKSWKNGKKTT